MIKEEIKQIEIQTIFSFISIITIIISIILLQDQKNFLEKKEHFLNPSDADNLSKFNRILILIVAIIFLTINYKLKDLSKNEDQKSYNLQIIASYLVVISSLITLYVVFTSPNSEITSDVENPII